MKPRRRLFPLILVVALFAGCAQDRAAVIEGRGWSWTRTEVESEWNRLRGGGTFARASREERERFVRSLVDRELLLIAAREAIPKLSSEGERKVRVQTEVRLIQDYYAARKAAWRPDSTRVRAAIARFSREVRADVVEMTRVSEGDSCVQFLNAGGGFEEAYARFDYRGGDAAAVSVGWRDPLWFPLRVARAIFLDDLPAGERTGAVMTSRGVWVTHALEYRPLVLRSRPGLAARTHTVVRTMLYRDDFYARRDSLRAAHGVVLHLENVALLARALRAHMDSLRLADPDAGRPDPWRVRGAYWRLSEEERTRPVFSLDGAPVTAEACARMLDGFDVRAWPTADAEIPLRLELQALVDRIVSARHAESLGLTRSEKWIHTANRIRSGVLLDEFHDRVLLPSVRISATAADSLYRVDPSRWKISERVELSALGFPEGSQDLARGFVERLRVTTPAAWKNAAEEVSEDVEGSIFISTTDLLDVDRVPNPPEWAPLLHAALAQPEGTIAGPVPALGGSAVVRVIRRLPGRPLERTTALVMAEREIRVQGIEARVAEVLRGQARRENVRLHLDRLDAR